MQHISELSKRIIEQLCKEVSTNIEHYNDQHISNIYWSLGQLKLKDTVLTKSFYSKQTIRKKIIKLKKLSHLQTSRTQMVENYDNGFGIFDKLKIEESERVLHYDDDLSLLSSSPDSS